ncbi:hypothetical protein BS78_01G179200 [Paspalum vaginatum]|nr:hypothetical protein BS78_01G179200 [Paspalum vaginatum]
MEARASRSSSSGAEAPDESREVQVAVAVAVAVVVAPSAGAAARHHIHAAAAVEVDELVRAAAVQVLVDEVLDVDEAVDAAGDGDGALVAEAVLALGLLQQRAEERVLEVAERDGEAALLLPLRAHPHRHAPLGRRHLLLLLLLAVHVAAGL